MRLRLVLAYEGTRYAGWQLQTRMADGPPGCCGSAPSPALPTIQGALEAGLTAILGRRIPVHGAGRTDAGVHAEGQVCHCDLPASAGRIDWMRALNTKLPPDIRVLEASWTGLSFHARRSAKAKQYAYSLWLGPERALPRVSAFVWSAPPLDPALFLPALPLLQGRHDFASFRNTGAQQTATVRTLYTITCLPGQVAGLVCPPDWPVLTLMFSGDGFLKQMVRNLVGLLVWIAQGKLPASAVPDILAAKDRRALPSPCAPAQGLTLLQVVY